MKNKVENKQKEINCPGDFIDNLKLKLIKFWRLNKLIIFLFIRDPKIYLISILITPILSFLIYWIWATLMLGVIFAPQMFVFISIGCLIVPLYVSIILGEWKATNFLKKIKSFNSGELSLIISLLNVNLIFSAFSLISSWFLALISVNFIYAFPLSKNIFDNTDWFIIVFYILATILIAMLAQVFYILVSNLANSRYMNITLNILSFLFIMLFSDVVLIPNVTADIKIFWILQYFNPLKYGIWVMLMIVSYQFLDPYGIRTIMSSNNLSDFNISFNNILIPLFVSVFTLVFILVFLKYKFVWGVKS